jgi:Ferric reductase like transmembrane component
LILSNFKGTIAWISLGVLVVTSLPFVRRYVWNLFMVLHVVFIGFTIRSVFSFLCLFFQNELLPNSLPILSEFLESSNQPTKK